MSRCCLLILSIIALHQISNTPLKIWKRLLSSVAIFSTAGLVGFLGDFVQSFSRKCVVLNIPLIDISAEICIIHTFVNTALLRLLQLQSFTASMKDVIFLYSCSNLLNYIPMGSPALLPIYSSSYYYSLWQKTHFGCSKQEK